MTGTITLLGFSFTQIVPGVAFFLYKNASIKFIKIRTNQTSLRVKFLKIDSYDNNSEIFSTGPWSTMVLKMSCKTIFFNIDIIQ